MKRKKLVTGLYWCGMAVPAAFFIALFGWPPLEHDLKLLLQISFLALALEIAIGIAMCCVVPAPPTESAHSSQ